MKPHIIKIRGIWHCRQKGFLKFTGLGYTPSDALEDWLKGPK